MLSKEYLVTGVFPHFDKSASQLTISTADGTPTCFRLTRRRYVGDGYIRARHGLKKPITFYAVTKCEGGRLISMSDGSQTRYYWLGPLRHSTYLANKPSRNYEQAWAVLDAALKTDTRLSATLFAKATRPFFCALPLMI